MDENQLRYKRLLNLSDDDVQYKTYRITIDKGTYVKRLVVRACCEQELHDSTKDKIISIKIQ